MDNIHELKWRKFLKRVWPFQYIPFIDFVFAAGSLATGDVHEESDFDVIIGVRQGRIFTTRFLCFSVFSLLGWWARHPTNKSNRTNRSYKDKLCFNHFVTPAAYRLSPPHNEYWKYLYQKLVPVYGDPIIIQKFYRANQDWLGQARLYQEDKRHKYKKSDLVKKFLEWILSGGSGSNIRTKARLGNWLEKFLKKIQLEKIAAWPNQQNEYKPRLVISDDEIEFHPDTKRIDLLLKQE